MSGAAHMRQLRERVQRLSDELRARELAALLVTGAVNVRYLTGFTGTSAVALVNARAAGSAHDQLAHRFITDFRYATQARSQVVDVFVRDIVLDNLLRGVAEALAGEGGRLGFSEKDLTVAQHDTLAELLGPRWELVRCSEVLQRMRAVKDEAEIDSIRVAAKLADEALLAVLEGGLAGRTERDVALEIELQMRRRGAEGPSFPPIVAAGAHAALPHAEARAEPIAPDVLVTIDWGALHEGYCSDCTRTYATGEGVGERARQIYELVRSTQQSAAEAVRAGVSGRAVDAIARAAIEQAGHGEHFGHGLGHGVGMEVHEGPRLARTAPEQPLLAGNVVTVEPGIYLPDQLGVRIEDLLVVRQGDAETLTGLPRRLTVVD